MHLLLAFLSFLLLGHEGSCDEILGCFGFVKSDVDIDFTRIEVKLQTSDGIIKHQSELAPNNGYYMIPFVEKGSFFLNIDPPSGWVFEPMSVKLEVDGVTDACSNNKDINFYFKGFTLSGKVVNQHSTSPGPGGVTLRLSDPASGKLVDTTTSVEGGNFNFKGVKPGSYKVTASHDSFLFHKAEIDVAVRGGNEVCGDDVIVSGYDVHGYVTSQSSHPVGDVHFLLFSQNEPAEAQVGCSSERPAGSEEVGSETHPYYVCSTSSSPDGRYLFATLPSASYLVMPFHRGDRIQFDVEPRQLAFSVTNHRIDDQKFQVVGFSVKGRITDSVGGRPIADAKVSVNGVERGSSDENGFYTLKNMNNGVYDVNVSKDKFRFIPRKLEVSTDTPQLPDIVPDHFAVCGSVRIDEKPKGFSHKDLTVRMVGEEGEQSAAVDNSDLHNFCFFASPGKYVVKCEVSAAQKSRGLAIEPEQVEVEVIDAPLQQIQFRQYRATVHVVIGCIKSCEGVAVKLDAGAKQTVTEGGNSLVFENVLPGKHELRVMRANWCWREEKKELLVTHQPAQQASYVVEFEQRGFLLTCSVSQDTTVDIEMEGKVVKTVDMKKRESKLCLSRVGVYNLVPRSCHRFHPSDVLVYDTDAPKHLTLNAIAHQARFTLTAAQRSEDSPRQVDARIKSSGKDETGAFLLSEALSDESKLVYELVHWVKGDGDKLVVTPQSQHFLFEPSSASVTTSSDDCSRVLGEFRAIVGKYLSGRVDPPIADVTVTITAVGSPEAREIVVRTDELGAYSYGPVHPDSEHTISASFADHSLLPMPNQPGSFVAKKLSKIVFQVTMSNDDGSEPSPLGGVLLAISGGNYRSRDLTDGKGRLVISQLEPGQFYFKAAMKEYKFTPSSQVIEVEEGKEKVIDVVGVRTAFSCYGNVTSLNGEAEPGVHVRARTQASRDGDGDDVTACQAGLVEEGVTDQEGAYVIKGLEPGCDYRITIDDPSRFTGVMPAHVTRSLEREDVHKVNFVVFRRPSSANNHFHLSGHVHTKAEHLPHITIALYRSDDRTRPIQTRRMSRESPFFYMERFAKHDGGEYIVRLESDLKGFDSSSPSANFFATGSHKHVTFHFHPAPVQHKTGGDNSQVSVASLPLTLLVVLLAYNYSKVLSLFQSGVDVFKGRGEGTATSSGGSKMARKGRK